MNETVGGAPATQPAPAAAPSAPASSVATGAGGVSGATGGGNPSGGASQLPSFSTQLAGNLGGPAAGSVTVGGQVFGQPAGQPGVAQPGAQPQQPAVTLESVQAELARVREEAQVAAQWARYGQQLYAQQQMQARQQPQQPAVAAEAPANPFGIPKFDKGLLRFFRANPQTGELEPTPYAPPTAYAEYQQYVEARRAAIEGFFEDPMKYLGDVLDKRIEEKAKALAQGQIQDVQTQGFARNFVESNADWLYQRGQDGGVARDIYGRPQFTQAGALFRDTCAQLHEAGVTDVQRQQKMAMDHVMGQIALQRLRATQQAAQQAQATQQQAVQQPGLPPHLGGPTAQPQPSAFGVRLGQNGQATPPNLAPPGPSLPGVPGGNGRNMMRQMLNQQFAAHGVQMGDGL